jgi:hypothetical protein
MATKEKFLATNFKVKEIHGKSKKTPMHLLES